MDEFNFTEEDMPNGHAILRKNQADETYEVEYIITDTNLNFIKESGAEGNRLYTTTKKDEFLTQLYRGIITYTRLINLELIPKGKIFMFYGLPLSIKSGDGSPVRAIAIIEN